MPVVVAVNKVDRLDRPRTVRGAPGGRRPRSAATPRCSRSRARTGRGVGPLVEHLAALLPEGPFYFPPEEISDQPEHVMLAELVREQVLHRTRQEVPHSVEVQVDEIHEQNELVVVHAYLWVETESQKGILIGARGRMIKSIGMAARRELERELGKRVHLDLSVRVRRSWRGDETLLDRLGITPVSTAPPDSRGSERRAEAVVERVRPSRPPGGARGRRVCLPNATNTSASRPRRWSGFWLTSCHSR